MWYASRSGRAEEGRGARPGPAVGRRAGGALAVAGDPSVGSEGHAGRHPGNLAMTRGGSGVSGWTYAGLFLVTLSTLMYELLFTRIFSVTMWYHFAFLACPPPCSG